MSNLTTFKARHHLASEILAGVDQRVSRWQRRRRLRRLVDEWVYPFVGVLLCAASTGFMVWLGALAMHYVRLSWH